MEDLILIHKGRKCDYVISTEGVIYRRYQYGLKQVEKRLGQRGFCEFKMDGKTVQYHQVVAKTLVPNPEGAKVVFFNSHDKFDLRPQNLRWVWTRYNQRFTPQQAIKKATDRDLIAYYKSGNRAVLDSRMIQIIDNMHRIFKKSELNGLLGELYLVINAYAERCLLFNLEADVMQTYKGLRKQQQRRKIQSLEINEKLL